MDKSPFERIVQSLRRRQFISLYVRVRPELHEAHQPFQLAARWQARPPRVMIVDEALCGFHPEFCAQFSATESAAAVFHGGALVIVGCKPVGTSSALARSRR
jgi:hypothetical protein